jgi:hypothetical protein
MQEFTNPQNGPMNLATHLPKHFVPPDLGPKSYIAYGSTEQKPPHDSVTRIHEDLCDAINILLYSAHGAELRPADVPAPAVELALPLAERTVGASPLSLVAHRSPFSPQRRWRAAERRHPHRPQEDRLAHPADTSISNLAAALGLLSRRLSKPDFGSVLSLTLALVVVGVRVCVGSLAAADMSAGIRLPAADAEEGTSSQGEEQAMLEEQAQGEEQAEEQEAEPEHSQLMETEPVRPSRPSPLPQGVSWTLYVRTLSAAVFVLGSLERFVGELRVQRV